MRLKRSQSAQGWKKAYQVEKKLWGWKKDWWGWKKGQSEKKNTPQNEPKKSANLHPYITWIKNPIATAIWWMNPQTVHRFPPFPTVSLLEAAWSANCFLLCCQAENASTCARVSSPKDFFGFPCWDGPRSHVKIPPRGQIIVAKPSWKNKVEVMMWPLSPLQCIGFFPGEKTRFTFHLCFFMAVFFLSTQWWQELRLGVCLFHPLYTCGVNTSAVHGLKGSPQYHWIVANVKRPAKA